MLSNTLQILSDSISGVLNKLETAYGIPEWEPMDPLDELMLTLLSQNTNDNNRDIAYRRLRARFSDWDSALRAEATEIEEAVRPAGLARQKSLRMKEILQWVRDRFGGMSLAAVGDFEDAEAISLLTARKGIGVKTAAVVLAFAFNRDLCPVDTHVLRISKRLRWAEPKMTADKVFFLLQPAIPGGKAATFHLNLLRFGRNVCTARNPKCLECFIWDDCAWGEKIKR